MSGQYNTGLVVCVVRAQVGASIRSKHEICLWLCAGGEYTVEASMVAAPATVGPARSGGAKLES